MPSTTSLPQHHEDLVGPGHPAEQQAAGPPEGAREEIAGDPAREAEDRDEDRHGPRHYRLRRGAPDALRGRWRYRLATTRTRPPLLRPHGSTIWRRSADEPARCLPAIDRRAQNGGIAQRTPS